MTARAGFVTRGGKRRVGKESVDGRWVGPFDTLGLANETALSLGRPSNTHICCAGGGSRGAFAYARFKLPIVNEPELAGAELFHYRMLEIYVSLRDEIGYSATRFLRSVRAHGGVERSLRDLSLPRPLPHFLRNEGGELLRRLHQSMEAVVVRPEFASLFTAWELEGTVSI